MAFSIIPTPSEIPLFKQQASCLSIAAGGDLTYLTVAKEGGKAVELLACGHGQFGGIGNGQWSHQGTPVRVKTLSGLIECKSLFKASYGKLMSSYRERGSERECSNRHLQPFRRTEPCHRNS
jgi:hypothetical protein